MKSMKVATWNVNSIRSRLERILAWTRREEPDVLCMQEIKTTDDLFPGAPFEELGYHVETWGQPTYNGVAILSRTRPAEVTRGLPGDAPDAQRRLIAAKVKGVRIINVYVPNGQSPESDKFVFKLQWLGRLRDWLDETASPSDPLLLLGDFNIAPDERDVHDPELWRGKIHFHPKEHEALARITAWGLFDLFRKHHTEGGFYSWWDYRQLAFPKNNGLRIDLVLGTARMLDRCKDSTIHRDERKGEGPSDHVPVVVEI
ncbi:MAG TPA: exodeoxyribonuclease III [Thermoanaerobaculia bacterium]|nr:exodeoxyribonuclease III [Thermoanaerobaculia bacterium]